MTLFAISSALAIGQAVSSYTQQGAAAKAQQAQNEQIAALNTKTQQAAVESYVTDVEQIQTKANFERDNATEKLAAARTQMLEEQSHARVAAGEAGVSGLSLTSLLGNYDLQFGNYADGVKRNTEAVFDQAEAEKRGAKATATSRYNSITPTRSVQEPSLIGLGLGIAGGTLNAAGRYLYEPPERPKTPTQKRGSDSVAVWPG